MKERGERQKAGDSDGHTRRPTIPTLPDLGITKSQSSRWQTLAALPEKQREEKITKATRKAVSGRSRGVAQDPRVSKSQN